MSDNSQYTSEIGPRCAALAEQLAGIAEELADLQYQSLRGSLEQGAQKASETEKRLARARRSVEKASHLLQFDPPSPDVG
ncbi:MAG: hypothetical protein OXE79_02915 [Acidimicrobiaceae bacterium]|nr:hypothetical protein [Acidimicrobiaceae bacterium]MCY4176093.1 hypothetical protein [Acidimicrobiaceae bacterium]MCY4279796.1 hypothetical protein [Acidimicrobiaceae bacterium]MCY4295089.1 hypothetical protein [Acidimicrobiaceae bacterium]